jgi:hypothetical protein
MSDSAAVLARIEILVDEIMRLDQETAGQFRQPSDREAHAIATRIEQKMLTNKRIAAE